MLIYTSGWTKGYRNKIFKTLKIEKRFSLGSNGLKNNFFETQECSVIFFETPKFQKHVFSAIQDILDFANVETANISSWPEAGRSKSHFNFRFLSPYPRFNFRFFKGPYSRFSFHYCGSKGAKTMDMFDGLIAEVRRAKPRKRQADHDDYLWRLVKQTWGCDVYHYLEGWQIYATRQRKGYCNYQKRYLAIPIWAVEKGIGYCTYILAHEIAHIAAGYKAAHGPEFMEAFKNICPKHLWHHETGYKPREAQRAGIASLASMKALGDFEKSLKAK